MATPSTSAGLGLKPSASYSLWHSGEKYTCPTTGSRAFASRRAELRSLRHDEVRIAAIAGFFLALHFGTWIPSLAFTTVASSVALVCTQPVWAAAMARARGEPIAARAWVGIGVALCGVLVL